MHYISREKGLSLSLTYIPPTPTRFPKFQPSADFVYTILSPPSPLWQAKRLNIVQRIQKYVVFFFKSGTSGCWQTLFLAPK